MKNIIRSLFFISLLSSLSFLYSYQYDYYWASGLDSIEKHIAKHDIKALEDSYNERYGVFPAYYNSKIKDLVYNKRSNVERFIKQADNEVQKTLAEYKKQKKENILRRIAHVGKSIGYSSLSFLAFYGAHHYAPYEDNSDSHTNLALLQAAFGITLGIHGFTELYRAFSSHFYTKEQKAYYNALAIAQFLQLKTKAIKDKPITTYEEDNLQERNPNGLLSA